MLGAIIGDVVGSRFEWSSFKGKDFVFFHKDCCLTDDSIMTFAVAQALLQSAPDFETLSEKAVVCMQTLGRMYPDSGYGGNFYHWIYDEDPRPYNSYGNGAAMRISAVGWAANSLEEAKLLSKKVTEVTHNHPEGMKGAEATAVAVYMARAGKKIPEIREYIDQTYYPMDFSLDEIRDSYKFDMSCQGSVPQALMAFFESGDFESAIRNAISIGGDSDTLAAICGGVAGAYYGVPEKLREGVLEYLDETLFPILKAFEESYGA